MLDPFVKIEVIENQKNKDDRSVLRTFYDRC